MPNIDTVKFFPECGNFRMFLETFSVKGFVFSVSYKNMLFLKKLSG